MDKLLEAAKSSRNTARDRCLLFLMFRHGLRVSEACGLKLACDSALLSHNNTCGLHCGVWVIDGASYQAYKVSVMASARSLSIGIGHNGPNTLAI